jgi:tripartite ATP-independent transporter DctM subunit
MEPVSAGLAIIAVLLLLLVLIGLGLPVAFALGLVGGLGALVLLTPAHLAEMGTIAFDNGTNFVFVSVPLFILMAELLTAAKLSGQLFEACSRFFNRVPGALAIASVVACGGFGAICGSSAATAATIGGPAIPEMLKRGYNKRMSIGCVAAGGTLGILIPPSIAMILFGVINQVSIGQLYLAGILPGIMMTALLAGAIALAVWMRPSLAPRQYDVVTWTARFQSLRGIWPVAVLAVVVTAPIYTGIATPTEAAALGAAGAVLFVTLARRIDLAQFREALLRTVTVSAMIMFLLIGGFTLGFVLTSLGIPQSISKFIAGLDVNRWVIMILINALFFLLARALDPLTIMVITMPVLFPVVTDLGFDPVWFGVIITINTEIDNILPPDGLNLLVLKGMAPPEVTMNDIIIGAAPFVLVLLTGMAIIMVFPEIALWLPQHAK